MSETSQIDRILLAYGIAWLMVMSARAHAAGQPSHWSERN